MPTRGATAPDIGGLMAAVKLALDQGKARVSPGRAECWLAGRCEEPQRRDFDGHVPPQWRCAPDKLPGEWHSAQNGSHPFLWITMYVECRACPACLRRRAWEWRGRAAAELAGARRTWFGTITLGPEAHALMAARAAYSLSLEGKDFEALSREAQFSARHHQCNSELTRYLKRVRKESGSFRYLLVTEAHKSGLPHYHCLLHEKEDGQVKHKCLQDQWRLGFTKWKLAEARSAAYCTKYLTKSAQARVRASQLYGDLQYLTKYYALAA